MKLTHVLPVGLLLCTSLHIVYADPPNDGKLHVILGGDHADPTIVRDGNNFYMTHSSYYYMTAAQGGTAGPATSHMVTSARSRSPLGPWENSPHNPIVHTWSRSESFWSKGHGTIIDDADGN